MPSSGEPAFPNELDIQDLASSQRIWNAQLPQLAVPVLGLPAIAVPTGVHEGLPMGVQIVSRRYREDLCLDAAEIIESPTGKQAIELLGHALTSLDSHHRMRGRLTSPR